MAPKQQPKGTWPQFAARAWGTEWWRARWGLQAYVPRQPQTDNSDDLTVQCGLLAAKTDAKALATKAAKAVKKGTFTKKARKPRYSVVFHRPKTLQRTRSPKYLRRRWVWRQA